MQITDYTRPELIVVAFVLYPMGTWTRQSEVIRGKHIPLINGNLGVVICEIYVLVTSTCWSGQEIFMAIFTVMARGILLAELSTYISQIIERAGGKE